MGDFTLASQVKVKSSFILISFLANPTQKNRPRWKGSSKISSQGNTFLGILYARELVQPAIQYN